MCVRACVCARARCLSFCSLLNSFSERYIVHFSLADSGFARGRKDLSGLHALCSFLRRCSRSGSLRSLNLSSNGLGSEAAQALSGALCECTSLTSLDISNNDIPFAAADALATYASQHLHELSSIPLAQLRRNTLVFLDLSGKGAGEVEAATLSRFINTATSLASLNVDGGAAFLPLRGMRAASDEATSAPAASHEPKRADEGLAEREEPNETPSAVEAVETAEAEAVATAEAKVGVLADTSVSIDLTKVGISVTSAVILRHVLQDKTCPVALVLPHQT